MGGSGGLANPLGAQLQPQPQSQSQTFQQDEPSESSTINLNNHHQYYDLVVPALQGSSNNNTADGNVNGGVLSGPNNPSAPSISTSSSASSDSNPNNLHTTSTSTSSNVHPAQGATNSRSQKSFRHHPQLGSPSVTTSYSNSRRGASTRYHPLSGTGDEEEFEEEDLDLDLGREASASEYYQDYPAVRNGTTVDIMAGKLPPTSNESTNSSSMRPSNNSLPPSSQRPILPRDSDSHHHHLNFVPDHLWFGGEEYRQRTRISEPFEPKRRHLLFIAYLPDWVVTLALWAGFYAIDKIDGFRRQFSLFDTSLQHTYATHERVPVWLLAILSGIVPLIIIIMVSCILMRSYWDLHVGILGLALGLAMTTMVTDAVKITVGRPRPDVIDRCQPITGAHDAPVYGLSTSDICTQSDEGILRDGFRSFPSGHSSFAFSGLGFLSFYIAGKLHLFDGRGHAIKAWLSAFPLVGAALIAVSRTMDYRHHWHDVTVGGILGLLMAYFAYRFYYPPLHHPRSHKAYSPRIARLNHHRYTDQEEDLESNSHLARGNSSFNHARPSGDETVLADLR